MTTSTRRPQERRAEILCAALALSHKSSFMALTREAVAERAECAPATISRIFGTMDQFRRAIISDAIRTKDLIVIAQALACGHPKTKNLPESLKKQARNALK